MINQLSTHHVTGRGIACDPENGTCTVVANAPARVSSERLAGRALPATVTLHVFTDPICSACWGLEPALRRLEHALHDVIAVEHHVGGLLPSWSVLRDGPVSGPLEAAVHWEQVAPHYRMPMRGDVWRLDPLDSSTPPSLAVYAASLQDPAAAPRLLRRLRELVFVEAQNIARPAVIAAAARDVGLDADRLLADSQDHQGAASHAFERSRRLAARFGVRAFPTLVAEGPRGRAMQVGARPWRHLVDLIVGTMDPASARPLVAHVETDTRTPPSLAADVRQLFDAYDSWTAHEVAVALDLTPPQADALLEQHARDTAAAGRPVPTRLDTPSGALWRRG